MVPRRARVLSAVLVCALCAGLGLAIATQVRDTASGDSLDTARPSDLVVLLDTLHQREATLREEITQLQDSIAAQQSFGQGSASALAEARARAQALAVLVGTAAASGPGVVLTVRDPQARVGPEVLLDVVQELRAAGAEAIQVSGADGGAVRVGMDTAVTGTAGALRVDGSTLSAPYRVTAIGDAPTLAAALNIPGGVIDTVARAGGGVAVEQPPQVLVDALRTPKVAQHARPAGR
ncbi:DUF881 domain-containing protein [Rhodococcus sp. X156]|uniref:DUF881 domain-containing protein n=1 Tax=Rhodococcus sp. X156 TaxID=2499145 RepID=UPI001F49CD50|nr:DUF881 domain-containing protein [Rhodococcus sp. X156]